MAKNGSVFRNGLGKEQGFAANLKDFKKMLATVPSINAGMTIMNIELLLPLITLSSMTSPLTLRINQKTTPVNPIRPAQKLKNLELAPNSLKPIAVRPIEVKVSVVGWMPFFGQ